MNTTNTTFLQCVKNVLAAIFLIVLTLGFAGAFTPNLNAEGANSQSESQAPAVTLPPETGQGEININEEIQRIAKKAKGNQTPPERDIKECLKAIEEAVDKLVSIKAKSKELGKDLKQPKESPIEVLEQFNSELETAKGDLAGVNGDWAKVKGDLAKDFLFPFFGAGVSAWAAIILFVVLIIAVCFIVYLWDDRGKYKKNWKAAKDKKEEYKEKYEDSIATPDHKKIEKLEKDIKTLKEENEKLTTSNSQWKTDHQQKEQECNRLSKDLNNAEHIREQIAGQFRREQERVSEKESEIRGLKEKLRIAQSTITQKDNAIAIAKRETAEAVRTEQQKAAVALQSKQTEVNNALVEARRATAAYTAKEQELQSARQDAANRDKQWRAAHDSVTAQLQNTRAALQDEKSRTARLEDEKQKILENQNKSFSIIFPQFALDNPEAVAFFSDVRTAIASAQPPAADAPFVQQKLRLLLALGGLKALLDANNNRTLSFDPGGTGEQVAKTLKDIGEIIPKCVKPAEAFDVLALWAKIINANAGDALRSSLKLYAPASGEVFNNTLMQNADPNNYIGTANRIYSWAVCTADAISPVRVFHKAVVA
jgi:hypothetical protein